MKDVARKLFLASQLPKRTLALVLAGGRGSRLKQLTSNRAKPAVFFGGKFRIIDFALSNCVNSGIRRIGVITQYRSHSLLRHIKRGWNFLRGEQNEFIDLLPAQQQLDELTWYRGTADSVLQNLHIIRSYRPEYVLVLAGDHIYKMDYSLMLLDHVESDALCSIACVEVPRNDATEFGVMAIDETQKITSFTEKPAQPATMPNKPDTSLASMGIYVFNADYLYALLEEDHRKADSNHDFGGDILPMVVARGEARAHLFGMSCVPSSEHLPPYWRDVGTVDSFWATNMDLTSNLPQLNLYDEDWPIWTYMEQLPAAKFVPNNNGDHGNVANTLVSGGCIISGSRLSHSILFSRVRVHSYCEIDQVVVLPGCEIGRHCRLRKVVIDRGCKIPEGMVIGENPEWDAQHFYRSSQGVVLVTQEMLGKLYNMEVVPELD